MVTQAIAPASPMGEFRRSMIVLAAGERSIGTSVSAALIALAASFVGTTLCVEATGRRSAFRWRQPPEPVCGLSSLASGDRRASEVVFATTSMLDVLRAHGEDDSNIAHRPDVAFERMRPALENHDTIVVDGGTNVAALSAACAAGAAMGMDVHLLLMATSGGAGLAAAHSALKAKQRMGVPAPAALLLSAENGERASAAYEMLDAAARRFLGERISDAGTMDHDACLDTALRGGMAFVDAAYGSPALAAAERVLILLGADGTSIDSNVADASPRLHSQGAAMHLQGLQSGW